MKLSLAVVVLASTIQFLVLPTELHGAPVTTSEQLGKIVQQIQELIKLETENAKTAYNSAPREMSNAQLYQAHPQKVTTQVSGVQIVNCGPAATAIGTALNVLGILFPGRFGVLVNCNITAGCTKVRVDVPADNVMTDVDVCDLGNGQACVRVYVEPTTTCSGIGLIPIVIPIPLSNGQNININIQYLPEISLFGQAACVTVEVNAPSCQTG